MEENEKRRGEELFPEQTYIGNVWGWKISFLSLAFILFFCGLVYYKHKYGGGLEEIRPIFEEPKPAQNTTDTLNVE